MKTKLRFLFIALALFAGVHPAQPGQVQMGITPAGKIAILFWPATLTNYVLQSTTNLNPPSWVSVSNLVPVISNNNFTVTVTNTLPARFFRLYNTNTTAIPSGMVLIPAGSFTMGDSLDGDSYSLPLHTVSTSAIYMDQFDVTKARWDTTYQWAKNHGYGFDNTGSGTAANHPVQTIDWYDAVKWCNARSEQEGRAPAYYTSAAHTTVYRTGVVDVDNSWVNWNTGYRLPTEAEWEKAARGGAGGQRFPWGDTISWSQANYYAFPSSAGGYAYDVNSTIGYNPVFTAGSTPYTSPVGYFAPNGYGLYDMGGNVWQWCWDADGYYSSASQADPRGPTFYAYRMCRGGSWNFHSDGIRAARRNGGVPAVGGNNVGFRCVLPQS